MSPNILAYTAGAMLLMSGLAAGSASAQTTFNATFNSTPSSACSIGDGCTNFTLNLGGVDFQIGFTSAGDGGTMIWENGFGDGNSASMNCLSDAENFISTELITIKRSDNAPFEFTSIYVNNTAGATVSIATYRSGSAVGTTQFATTGSAGTYNFSNILVDEIRMSATDFYNTNIDSFKGAVVAGNTAPVLTNSGGSTAAIEQVPAVIDSSLTLSDTDNSTLPAATVSITGNYNSGQDTLAFTNNGTTMGNIAASFNAATGVLQLTSAGGTATIAQWQAALRSVTYTNTSNTPGTSNRTITFSANDGTASSSSSTKTVTVSAVNDTPVITAPAGLSVPRNQQTALTGISGSDADAGSASVTMTFSVPSGTFAATSGSGVTAAGSGTSSLTLTGTLANLNAYIAGSNVNYTSVSAPPPSLDLTLNLSDNGNTGSGGVLSDSETVTITITAPSSVDAWLSY